MLVGRERYLALAVMAVLVAYLADRLVLSPLLESWRRDGDAVTQLRSEISEATLLAESLPSWRAECQRRRELAFPAGRTETENEALKALATRAADRGVQLKGLRPAWREAGTTGKNSPAQLELAVSASGSLAGVVGFLYDIETMPGPVRAERTRLHAKDETGRVLDLDLVVSVLASTAEREEVR
jgi:hypothetical protein